MSDKTYLTGLAEARSYYSLHNECFECECGISFSWTKVPRLAMLDHVDLFNDIPKDGSEINANIFDTIATKFQLLKNEGDTPVDYESKDFEESMAAYQGFIKDIDILKEELEIVKRICSSFQDFRRAQQGFDSFITFDVASITRAQKDVKALKFLRCDGNTHIHIKNVRGAVQKKKKTGRQNPVRMYGKGASAGGYNQKIGYNCGAGVNSQGEINFE